MIPLPRASRRPLLPRFPPLYPRFTPALKSPPASRADVFSVLSKKETKQRFSFLLKNCLGFVNLGYVYVF